MPFFVEPPQDEYGNRMYTNQFPCVVEAEKTAGTYKVIAPPEIAARWPTISAKIIETWVKCWGPARLVTRNEQDAIITACK